MKNNHRHSSHDILGHSVVGLFQGTFKPQPQDTCSIRRHSTPSKPMHLKPDGFLEHSATKFWHTKKRPTACTAFPGTPAAGVEVLPLSSHKKCRVKQEGFFMHGAAEFFHRPK